MAPYNNGLTAPPTTPIINSAEPLLVDFPNPSKESGHIAGQSKALPNPSIAINQTDTGPFTTTVGPVETWKADKVSIWHAGMHDNPFGQRLTSFMIAKKIMDSSVPMSLLADHPNVQFNFYRNGLGSCEVVMH